MRPKTADDGKPSDEGKSSANRPGKRAWQDEPAGRFMDRERAGGKAQVFERVVWDEV